MKLYFSIDFYDLVKKLIVALLPSFLHFYLLFVAKGKLSEVRKPASLNKRAAICAPVWQNAVQYVLVSQTISSAEDKRKKSCYSHHLIIHANRCIEL